MKKILLVLLIGVCFFSCTIQPKENEDKKNQQSQTTTQKSSEQKNEEKKDYSWDKDSIRTKNNSLDTDFESYQYVYKRTNQNATGILGDWKYELNSNTVNRTQYLSFKDDGTFKETVFSYLRGGDDPHKFSVEGTYSIEIKDNKYFITMLEGKSEYKKGFYLLSEKYFTIK